jgi:hypothetical protein
MLDTDANPNHESGARLDEIRYQCCIMRDDAKVQNLPRDHAYGLPPWVRLRDADFPTADEYSTKL